MEVYKGYIRDIKNKGLTNKGTFIPEKGNPFIVEGKYLPFSKNKITIQGEFSANNIFYVKRYYLTENLKSFLPPHLVEKNKKRIEYIDKILGNNSIIEILNEPEILDQLGIKTNLKTKILHYINFQYSYPNLANYLIRFNLEPKKIKAIHETLGPRAIEIIEKNPYELTKIPSIPFKIADNLANEKGILPTSTQRIEGAIQYVYHQYLNSGNSYLTTKELENRVYYLLDKTIPNERIRFEIERYSNEERNQALTLNGLFYDKHLFFSELQIAQRLADLTLSSWKMPKNLNRIIDELIKEGEIPKTIDNEQRSGIEKFFLYPVLLVTGGAGTGKTSFITFLTKTIRRILPQAKIKIAAPTAKVARLLTTQTGIEAKTIHSLLGKGIDYKNKIIYHHSKKPLDADVLIIDEAPMINEYIMRDIVWAIENGTKLVLVGDPNQLEPIGPGKPFIDMLEFGFPTVRLTRNYRNDSAILKVANAILAGKVDESLLYNNDEIRIIETNSIEETKEKIVEVYKEYESKYPVITMYREDFSLGVEKLNTYIKKHINPTETIVGMGLNDPVMQIENNREKDIDNGEVGVIIKYDKLAGATVEFNSNKIREYTLDEMLDQLELAYAMTTMKTQGSEYEGIIIPLIDIKKELSNRNSMWYRNSLYTAFTRAKKKIILIGDMNEFFDGVKRTGPSRKTKLNKYFKNYIGETLIENHIS